jgi:hypothetical protein
VAAPIEYVSGPMMHRETGPHRRYVGPARPVLAVRVGKSEALRFADLSEEQLLRIATGALAALEHLRQKRFVEQSEQRDGGPS